MTTTNSRVGRFYPALHRSEQTYNCSNAIYGLLHEHFIENYGYHSLFEQEYFFILLFDCALHHLQTICVAKGGINMCSVDYRIIFKHAILHRACGIVLAHNHPSGRVKPSSQDLKLTEEIINASNFLHFQIIDHLIIGGEGYFSFADEGIIVQDKKENT